MSPFWMKICNAGTASGKHVVTPLELKYSADLASPSQHNVIILQLLVVFKITETINHDYESLGIQTKKQAPEGA
jgi:hypothetical protein